MNPKGMAAAVLGVAFLAFLLLAAFLAGIPWPATGPAPIPLGDALWRDRTFEVLLQAVILLGGVISILLLLEAASLREVGA